MDAAERKKWERTQRDAKRAFEAMDSQTRWAIADEMVWGSFDWREYFDEKPAPGFTAALFDLIQRWEDTYATP